MKDDCDCNVNNNFDIVFSSCKEVFYNKEQKEKDLLEIKHNKKIIREMNKLIDMILNKYSDKYKYGNSSYSGYMNREWLKISYETNFYGRQPRYKVNYKNYHYYYGKIYKFIDIHEPVETSHYENDIIGCLSFLNDVQNSPIFDNKRINKQIGKMIKLINKILK